MSYIKRTGLIQGSKLHKKALGEQESFSTSTNGNSPFKFVPWQPLASLNQEQHSGYDEDKLGGAGYDMDMMKKRRWWKRGGKDKDLVAYNKGFEISDFEAMEPL